MYVLDDRYVTIVAFIQGCDSATEGRLLAGFNGWVSRRLNQYPSALTWSTQIANKHGFATSVAVPTENQEEVIDDLFAMLNEYLSEWSDAD